MSPASSAAGLEGRHAVVTGGGRGIGDAVARALYRHGATLTLMGRDRARLTAAAAAYDDTERVGYAVLDVADEDSVDTAFTGARATLGAVDILVNNAGIAESAPFKRTDPPLWRRVLDVDLTGTYLCTRAVFDGMLTSNWGRIVNIASTAGITGYAYVTAYAAAKHGVVGLTRSLARECARTGITVNAVCPSYVDTDMTRQSVQRIVEKTGRTEAEAMEVILRQNPQGRLVTPEEVANTVLWLCLPGSETVTGQAIALAGGEVMP